MDEQNYTSGRGGKREGAGRPAGTTNENKKKPVSFKLSDKEEKTIRAVLKDMRNDNLYKYEKQVALEDGFKPILGDLDKKYGKSLRFSIYYDSIYISYRGAGIKDNIAKVINNLIAFAKKELDEEYYLSSVNPAEISPSPLFAQKENITYCWLLERRLKEDEDVDIE